MLPSVSSPLPSIDKDYRLPLEAEQFEGPSKTVSDQYRSVEVSTTDHQTLLGLVSRDDAETLAIQMTPVERPVAIAKVKVASRRPSAVSLMPEGLVDDLSQQELADLLAFLLSPPPQ